MLLVNSAYSQGVVLEPKEKGWRGVIPLVSTRSDVESLLGSPMPKEKGFVLTYDTNDYRVVIWYNGAKPAKDNPCKWNVSSETVVYFVVVPKKIGMLSELGLDLTKFVRNEDMHTKWIVYYHNEKEGITIETRKQQDESGKFKDGEEIVTNISYGPTPLDKEQKCIPNIVSKQKGCKPK